MRHVIVDTGPLVAYLNLSDRRHDWTVEAFSELEPPFYTCEAVLSEAVFLVLREAIAADALLELIERGLVQLAFDLRGDFSRVRQLMRRYRDQPMSLADACLVRMTERMPDCVVVTLDHHFNVYRRLDREKITARIPPQD